MLPSHACLIAIGLVVAVSVTSMPLAGTWPTTGNPLAATSPGARSAGVHPLAGSISLSPTSGPVGTTVTVNGSSFGSPVLATLITITFDGTNVSTSPSTCYTTNSAFTCSFKAPSGPGGPNTVAASGGSSTATATFTETGSLWFSPTGVDVGQIASASGGGFGGSLPISPFTLGSTSLNCTGASIGSCSSGVTSTNSTGWFTATFVAPSVSSSATYRVNATDSAGKSESGNLSVDLDPTVTTPTASQASIDVGQTVSFSAAASLGSGGYTYAWSGFPGCPGDTNPTLCTATTAGVFMIVANVTDSNGFQASSDPLRFTVDPGLTVTTPTAAPASIDVNQSVTFATTASGGTGLYRSYSWTGLPPGCAGMNATINCTPQAASYGYITVTATDSNGRTSAGSGVLAFAVDADPLVMVPVANRSSADVGQGVSFTASVSHGSGRYSYAWTGLPSGCMGTAPTAVCLIAVAGSYAVRLEVTDSNGYWVRSDSLEFDAYADPAVTLATPRSALDSDQPFDLNAVVANGSGGTTYAWAGLPPAARGRRAM